MPLTIEDSISSMADTTISTSPPVPVKRAARTYGRAKETLNDLEGVDTTRPDVRQPVASHNLFSSTFNLEPKTFAGASSRLSSNDEATDDENQRPGTEMSFGWKKRLAEWADSDEENDSRVGAITRDATQVSPMFRSASISNIDTAPSNTIDMQSPDVTHRSVLRTLPPSDTSHMLQSSPSSPSSAPLRRMVKRKTDMVVSGSESDEPTRKSPFASSPVAKKSSPPSSDHDDAELPVNKSKSEQQKPFHTEPGMQQTSKQGRKSKTKLKPPTKKELVETNLDRYRIAAEQQSALAPKVNTSKFTVGSLMATLRPPQRQLTAQSSDPIMQFSSPVHRHLSSGSASKVLPLLPAVAGPSKNVRPVTPPLTNLDDEDSDCDMPSPSTLLRREQEKQEKQRLAEAQEKKAKALREAKAKIIARQNSDLPHDSGDESDLEIEPFRKPNRTLGQTHGHQFKLTAAKKAHLAYAGISQFKKDGRRASGPSTRAELDRLNIQNMHAQQIDTVKRNEEHWVESGGKIPAHVEGAGADQSSFDLEHAIKVLQQSGPGEPGREVDDDDDDEEDEDFEPQTERSASPHRLDNGEDDVLYSADVTMVNEETEKGEEEENDENRALGLPSRRKPIIAIMDSDSEKDYDSDGENQPIACKESVSSTGEHTSDEADKENNTENAYEDKENLGRSHKALFFRPGPLSRQGSLSESMRLRLSLSPGERAMEDVDDDVENQAGRDLRTPLRSLDDDPFCSPLSFAAKLQRSASSSFEPDNTQGTMFDTPDGDELSPFGGVGKKLGFSGGFAKLFEADSQRSPSRSTQTSANLNFLKKANISRQDSLDLTQDIGLGAAFDVPESRKRQADAIYEKEQDFVLDAAIATKVPVKPDLYVDEHGFLTQTRPDPDAQVYRSALTPPQSLSSLSQPFMGSLSSVRGPLRTLSLTQSDFDMADDSPIHPSQQPRRRLMKRTSTPTKADGEGSRFSASPSPPPILSAFNIMMAPKPIKPRKPLGTLGRSALVAEEAVESDDDDQFGFGKSGSGDEEDGEDLDRTLTTLVNDDHMEESEIAAEKIQEKYQEQADQDDAALEELHMRAVKGEIRQKKRNRGIGLDDSDEDGSDDEHERAVRRRMKKHKIDRQNIAAYGKAEETAAFYEAYVAGVKDEDDTGLNFLGPPVEGPPESQNMEDDEEEDSQSSPQEFITREEIAQQIRERAENNDFEEEEDRSMDWERELDGDDDEPQVNVRQASSWNLRKHHAGNEHDRDLKSWAGRERKIGYKGTGRGASGAAITAHKKVKAGNGSLRNAKGETGTTSRPPARPLKALPSRLKAISAQQSLRFDS